MFRARKEERLSSITDRLRSIVATYNLWRRKCRRRKFGGQLPCNGSSLLAKKLFVGQENKDPNIVIVCRAWKVEESSLEFAGIFKLVASSSQTLIKLINFLKRTGLVGTLSVLSAPLQKDLYITSLQHRILS